MTIIEPQRRAAFHALTHIADASLEEGERDTALSTLSIALGLDGCAVLFRDGPVWRIRATSHSLDILDNTGLSDGAHIEVAAASGLRKISARATKRTPLVQALAKSGMARGVLVARDTPPTGIAILGTTLREEGDLAEPPSTVVSVFNAAIAIMATWHFPKTHLPAAERAVLMAFAMGATPADIADTRGTSVRTIRHQLENARQRLGGRTNSHAVALAVSRRLIELGDSEL